MKEYDFEWYQVLFVYESAAADPISVNGLKVDDKTFAQKLKDIPKEVCLIK